MAQWRESVAMARGDAAESYRQCGNRINGVG